MTSTRSPSTIRAEPSARREDGTPEELGMQLRQVGHGLPGTEEAEDVRIFGVRPIVAEHHVASGRDGVRSGPCRARGYHGDGLVEPRAVDPYVVVSHGEFVKRRLRRERLVDVLAVDERAAAADREPVAGNGDDAFEERVLRFYRRREDDDVVAARLCTTVGETIDHEDLMRAYRRRHGLRRCVVHLVAHDQVHAARQQDDQNDRDRAARDLPGFGHSGSAKRTGSLPSAKCNTISPSALRTTDTGTAPAGAYPFAAGATCLRLARGPRRAGGAREGDRTTNK